MTDYDTIARENWQRLEAPDEGRCYRCQEFWTFCLCENGRCKDCGEENLIFKDGGWQDMECSCSVKAA